jgi:hypothetical protein
MKKQRLQAKFPLGNICITNGAVRSLAVSDVVHSLRRHSSCDWGDVCVEDWEENNLALNKGFRLFSIYKASDGTKFYIVTEADRSSTTILLPEEY